MVNLKVSELYCLPHIFRVCILYWIRPLKGSKSSDKRENKDDVVICCDGATEKFVLMSKNFLCQTVSFLPHFHLVSRKFHFLFWSCEKLMGLNKLSVIEESPLWSIFKVWVEKTTPNLVYSCQMVANNCFVKIKNVSRT